MKLVASIPSVLALFAWATMVKTDKSYYKNPHRLWIPLCIAIVIRCLIVIPLNYYYVIPIWTGMSPAVAMKVIPWFVIAGFNGVQTIIDVWFAWMLVYTFKLNRFASGETSSV